MVITVEQQKIEVPKGTNALDIARQLDKNILKDALAVKVNGKAQELQAPIEEDAAIEYLTFSDEAGRKTLRHTASHVLAAAVKNLYPETKLAIGPAIENGFYYDFDREESFTPEDLIKIEKEMKRIIKKNEREVRFSLPREEAIKYMQEKDEPYKVELIKDLPGDEEITFYRQGDSFVDLCAGPHLPSTGKIKAFKLTSLAGAYWRGDEKNKMLQRIYGTAFTNKEDLNNYLELLEEAKKRDHRKLGRELDLFDILDEGPGFPFFYPNGMVLRNILEDFWRKIHTENGYQEIKTPIILSKELWERSGHWENYRENMYTTKIDEQDYA
ncbi:MAG: TGS domain-containing protein, partial [Christensenellales bacterium]